jgi:hypothetical protein
VPKRPAEVFLNIPYDEKFDRLFRAYICGLSAFGLVPRATLEIPGGARRLDRILELIWSCAYAIHSRVELDAHKPRTPRFNMSFELGLSVAYEKSPKKRKHEWFVCESMNFRLAKSPARRRATNCSLSSIAEHSFQGISFLPNQGESVTHVSGTMCYLCLRPLKITCT